MSVQNPIDAAPLFGRGPGRRQQKVGRVVSNKMQKTIVVAVESLKKHRIYKKTYKVTRKFKAHDETNVANIGDVVRIEETRPLSKEKRWRLVEILTTSAQTPPVAEVAAADIEEELIGGGEEEDEGEEEES
jgi:small subunit ribosomal protein S17